MEGVPNPPGLSYTSSGASRGSGHRCRWCVYVCVCVRVCMYTCASCMSLHCILCCVAQGDGAPVLTCLRKENPSIHLSTNNNHLPRHTSRQRYALISTINQTTDNNRLPCHTSHQCRRYALKTGGPACLVWGWLLTAVMTIVCALAMGEICST